MMRVNVHPLTRGASARHQGGIVLIMALILLVVISTVALLTIRGAISSEQVSNNMRSSAVATQSAETALRYCEWEALKSVSSSTTATIVPVPPAADAGTPPTTWSSRAAWTALTSNTVTVALANSTDAAGRTVTAALLPSCMIEQYEFPKPPGASSSGGGLAFLVTARGYSPDYQTNAGGTILSGGEVWLQSIVRLPN